VAVARRGGRDEHACWDRGLLKNASTGEGLGAAFCKLFPPLPQVPLAKSLHGLQRWVGWFPPHIHMLYNNNSQYI
jgi:hypothetical protein